MNLDRLDFIKIDVEGFELEVLSGAKRLLSEYKPRVLLEMNHWCLNVFHRISIPEFHETLSNTFPALYAVEDEEVLDFSQRSNISYIFEQHILKNRFMNVVAGYDSKDLETRLLPLTKQALKPILSDGDTSTRAFGVRQGTINCLQWLIEHLQR